MTQKGILMAIAHTLDKTRKDLEKTIAEGTPLYAVVGAGDLAVEKLRGARAELSARVESVQTAPDQVKALPVRAQAAVEDAVATAVAAYGDLASRGKTLLTRVRSQQATTELEDQVKSTVSKTRAAATTAKKSAARTRTSAKGTATTAKKSAGRTTTSAKGTATTAKKSAGRTTTSAKAATTSAKKSATAAKRAAESTAAKVGD